MISKRLLLAALFLTASYTALAQQLIHVRDGETAVASISMTDLTRIRMSSGRIVKVRGNDGEVVIEIDKNRGELFVRPLAVQKPVNLFLTSDSGSTFVLLLTPKAIPSDTLVLREGWTGQSASNAATDGESMSAGYQPEIKHLVVAMARGDMPRGYHVQEINRKVRLWKNTLFTLEREYQGRNYVGQLYSLTNTGADPIVMAEPEFYRDGVMAVSVERMQLTHNQSTNVYIVRKRLPND
jgi:conjugal transfer pilus assembly protein TraK